MNTEKFTQKSIEAIQSAQSIAIENNNFQITPEHLTYALLDQEGGLIASLLAKMGADVNAVLAALDTEISRIPGVTGSGRDPEKVYVSPETDKILAAAQRIAQSQKDEYISVEHIALALFDSPTPALSRIFKAHGLDKNGFLKALATVKNSRVTGDNPEETYDALNKYGTDLVARAREQSHPLQMRLVLPNIPKDI